MAPPPTRGAVLVTGASGGIGSATVQRLAGRGYTVYAAVRGETGEVSAKSGVRVVEMNVTDPSSVDRAAKEVAEDVGEHGLRAVVNNAGVIVQGALELVPPDELRRQFEVNALGPVHVIRAFLPMIRQGRGRIVNVSAPTARVPVPFLAPIGASKAALASLSDAIRGELAAWNVPVVLVEPGATSTSIFAKAVANEQEALGRTEPARVELYERQLAAVGKAAADQRTSPPDSVAKTIMRAVEVSRPKRRYVSGSDARMISGDVSDTCAPRPGSCRRRRRRRRHE